MKVALSKVQPGHQPLIRNMEPPKPAFKFIRRVAPADYLENQDIEVSITIPSGGGTDTDTDTVENLPKVPDTGLEIELDDGSVYVLLAYQRK